MFCKVSQTHSRSSSPEAAELWLPHEGHPRPFRKNTTSCAWSLWQNHFLKQTLHEANLLHWGPKKIGLLFCSKMYPYHQRPGSLYIPLNPNPPTQNFPIQRTSVSATSGKRWGTVVSGWRPSSDRCKKSSSRVASPGGSGQNCVNGKQRLGEVAKDWRLLIPLVDNTSQHCKLRMLHNGTFKFKSV